MNETDFSPLAKILSDFNSSNHEARRVFHGRGHCFPGLEWFVVDYYAPVLFVSIFNQPPDSDLETLKSQLLSVDAEVIVLQHRYDNYKIEEIRSELPERWYAQENELRFHLQTGQQNIGLFLDMRPLREWLAVNAQKSNVLNLFAYTCSISVAAAKGGARSIVNVDLSSKSLGKGQLNHHLNKLSHVRVNYLAHNVFKSWGKIKKLGAYDIVVVDPPSFQKGSFEMSKDYLRLLKKLPELLNDKATVFLALNAPGTPADWLLQQMKDAGLDWPDPELMPRAPGFTEKHGDAGLKVLKFTLG